MSILGIDFGTSGSVLASVRSGKLQVLRTAVSERSTPALVSYTNSGERIMGDEAEGSLNTNFKRTANNMKFLLGASGDDKDFVEAQRKYTIAPISKSSCGHVQYDLEGRSLPVVQATASFLLKLQETAKAAMNTQILGGCVIGVPSFYGPTRVETMKAAAEISGLPLLATVTETKAIAMDYGIYRRKQFDEKEPITTAFVSIGHGACTVSIVDFTAHYAQVLVDECHTDLGGRRLDTIIVNHLDEKFKKSSGGLEALKNAKARIKLESTAQKIKKTLSANKETTYNLEYLLDGEDLNGTLTKTEFEAMSEGVREEFKAFMKECVTKLPEGKNASSVELVGNGTRVPWIMEIVENALETKTCRTLSADETISKGCALFAAMFSPTVKINGYPIFESWEKVPRKLRNPPPPAPVEEEKPAVAGFMSGFLNKKTPKEGEDQTPATEATDTPTATDAEEGTDTPRAVEGEEKEEEAATEEEPVVEESEESEELPPRVIVEDPATTPAMYNPGTVRGFVEQEKAQRKVDEKSRNQKLAINNFESFIFLCRDRARSSWKSVVSAEGLASINTCMDGLEDWLYDHMGEEFTVYEDKQDELKSLCSKFVEDFKPPKPVEPEVVAPTEGTKPSSTAGEPSTIPADSEATATAAAEATTDPIVDGNVPTVTE